MEGIINSIKNLFSTYGFKAAMIIIATIVIVNFIKKPIVRKAANLAEEKGYDKSIITKYITYLPVAVAFIINVIVDLIIAKFNFTVLNFGGITANAVIYGALAIATYEAVKKQLEAYAAKKNTPAIETAPPKKEEILEEITEETEENKKETEEIL